VQRITDDVLQLANTGHSELRALLTDIRSNRLTSAGLAGALEHLAEDARMAAPGVTSARSTPKSRPNMRGPSSSSATTTVYGTSSANAALSARHALLTSGADPNQADRERLTPLHFAALARAERTAALLLEHGASAPAVDRYGNTPLWTAVYNYRGRGDVIALLRHTCGCGPAGAPLRFLNWAAAGNRCAAVVSCGEAKTHVPFPAVVRLAKQTR
jgi:hypothetical protein